MKEATKEQAIAVLKSALRLRIKKKGLDLKTISDKWLTDTATKIYEETTDKIMVLEETKAMSAEEKG
jgi:hypothetical protein